MGELWIHHKCDAVAGGGGGRGQAWCKIDIYIFFFGWICIMIEYDLWVNMNYG